MNPLLNNLMMLMGMGQNPQQIMQNAIAQNPQLRQILLNMQGRGMSAKDMCMQLAQQQGIDLAPIAQYFQQQGIKL